MLAVLLFFGMGEFKIFQRYGSFSSDSAAAGL